MKFKEELLQFIWQYKLFAYKDLYTVKGEPLEIIDTGKLNVNAGADFIHAKVKIGQMVLAGNIELHVREKDWLLHKHQEDKAYSNIILHVVYQADQSVQGNFETLELHPFIDKKMLHTYQIIFDNKVKIPCYYIFKRPPEGEYSLWLDHLTIERLEQKITSIHEIFLLNHSDWNRTTVVLLAGYLGGELNKEPFMQLMMSFDFRIMARYCKNIFKMEALLFGQAGFLDNIDLADDYQSKLQSEYQYLKTLFDLKPIQVTAWKFSRLRPSAFPTIRIAQLAQLLFVHQHLFDELIKHFNYADIHKILSAEASVYWDHHYQFGCTKKERVTKSIGQQSIDTMLINVIVPLLFYYGKRMDQEARCSQALALLEQIKPEKNHIMRLWESLKLLPNNAFHSQALIQLKNQYCNRHQCLKCKIGLHLLKGH